MSKRTTVDVSFIKEKINYLLKNDDRPGEIAKAEREGALQFAETLLMQAKQYKGFGYLTKDDIPEGHLPGIHSDKPVGEQFANTDHTRVFYY